MEFTSTGPRTEIQEAFITGLCQKFGPVMGAMLAEVIPFYAGVELDSEMLKKVRDDDAAAVLSGILSGTANGATMRGIRGQLIASALMADRDSVVRWATEGQNRCTRTGEEWAATLPQWQWVLDNPDRFIVYARHLKYLFNQL